MNCKSQRWLYNNVRWN